MSGFIGVLMLDTAFPRITGDVGNPASYPMPVRLHVVAGADVPRIVRGAAPDPALVEGFIAGARVLEAAGAVGIVTSCGFLVHVQAALAASVRVPVMASALSLGPMIRVISGGRRLGVLTADASALNAEALAVAGLAAADVSVAGLEDAPVWQQLILASKAEQAQQLNPTEIGDLAVARALALQTAHPDLGAILLECGNLPPYAARIRAATGLPVWHILDAARLIWEARPAAISPD